MDLRFQTEGSAVIRHGACSGFIVRLRLSIYFAITNQFSSSSIYRFLRSRFEADKLLAYQSSFGNAKSDTCWVTAASTSILKCAYLPSAFSTSLTLLGLVLAASIDSREVLRVSLGLIPRTYLDVRYPQLCVHTR